MPPTNTASGQKSPYDFLNNSTSQPKRSLLPTNLSFRHKLLAIGGVAVIVMIIIAIVSSLFLKGGAGTVEQMRALAIEQNELIRVADIGTEKARSSSTLNLATTTKSTLISDQRVTIAYVTSQKQKLPAKELVTGKNTKTDDLLRRAEQANQFDEVFTKELQTELKKYQANVKKAYDEASSKKAKTVLSDNYNHVKVLVSN